MSFVNFSTKEITTKIVYYGPGLCGKTTTLQYIYDSIVPENKGQIVSLATDVDRTIYFDFLPLKLGKIQNFSVRIQLYTVPGQVRYNSTRKLVLSGTDGVVFVADSQRELMEENLKSYRNLVENLSEHGISLETLPHILQFNKRDLPNLASVEELNRTLNQNGAAAFETCATTGEGVLEGLKTISKLVMQDLNRKGVIRRKRAAGHRSGHHRTDAILRPLVGLASLEETRAGPATVVEYEEGSLLARSWDGWTGEEMELDQPEHPGSQAEAAERRRSQPFPVSFAEVFDDPVAAGRMRALEEAVRVGRSEAIQKLTKELFYSLVEDDRFFPPDMTESSRISMLGVSLRKYAHFYRLLSQTHVDRPESLFLLHFLVDVHFGKGMP